MKLPFTRDGSGVACLLHHCAEGRLIRIKLAELSVVPNVVSACHDFDTARRADRFGITIVELDASSCQFIKTRSLKVVAPIAADVVVGDVVRHD